MLRYFVITQLESSGTLKHCHQCIGRRRLGTQRNCQTIVTSYDGDGLSDVLEQILSSRKIPNIGSDNASWPDDSPHLSHRAQLIRNEIENQRGNRRVEVTIVCVNMRRRAQHELDPVIGASRSCKLDLRDRRIERHNIKDWPRIR